MHDRMPAMSLESVLDPRCIAVVGASDDPDKIGGRPFVHLARNGYAGPILAVNPNRTEVQGLPSFPDVASLPEVPDVAIVAVPGEAAIRAVADLAAAGTEVAVVMASGFGEVGEAGRVLEGRLRQAALDGGMRIVGPNSMGVCNFATGAVLTFTTALLEVPPVPGPVAVVSQSGSMAAEPYLLLAHEGIGVRQVHASGNDADVSVFELAALAARDPGVELLLLYFESMKDVRALEQLGEITRERQLPVIALKSGRTTAGQAAARSHTGALATEDRVVDAVLERHGIWRARDLDDLMRATSLHLRGWRPRGTRLGVISNSGASCVQIADATESWALELAALRPETTAALDAILPAYATTTNPVDLTASVIGKPHLFAEVIARLSEDPSVDALQVALPIAGQGYDLVALAADLGAVAARTPVVVSCPMPEALTEPFTAARLPLFRTETEAVAALGSFLGQRQRLAAAIARPPAPYVATKVGPGRMLDEVESMAVLAGAGVPVVAHRLCASPEEAVEAFRALGGGPVVVKGCTALVAHKSDLGLVRLGLDSEGAVFEAATDVAAALRRVDPTARGILVARMAHGAREVLVGAHQDPAVGPIVLVGDGGVHAELMPDVQMLLPPFDEDDVLVALSRLRAAPVLAGARGQGVDLAAVARTAVAVGRLIVDPAAGVVALDINPLIVAVPGAGCVAADAVVFVSDGDAHAGRVS
jgi:acyl-CoA synthetase (NDP forming)